MTTNLTIDDSEARAAAEELRNLVAEGSISNHLRERIAVMLGRDGAIEIVVGKSGLMAGPSSEMLSVIATLRAHQPSTRPQAARGF